MKSKEKEGKERISRWRNYGTSKDKIVSGVKIGNIEGFPLDGSILYYCPEDDMLYIFPVEEIGRKLPRYVYVWYTFTDILRLDSKGAEVGFSE